MSNYKKLLSLLVFLMVAMIVTIFPLKMVSASEDGKSSKVVKMYPMEDDPDDDMGDGDDDDGDDDGDDDDDDYEDE